MNYKFTSTDKFEKNLLHLPKDIQHQAKDKILMFMNNPFSKSLVTHKLKGKLDNLYSFSINYSYRAIFMIEGSQIILLDIGTHDIYYKG